MAVVVEPFMIQGMRAVQVSPYESRAHVSTIGVECEVSAWSRVVVIQQCKQTDEVAQLSKVLTAAP